MQSRWGLGLLLLFCLFGCSFAAPEFRMFPRDEPAPSTSATASRSSVQAAASSTTLPAVTAAPSTLTTANASTMATRTVSQLVLPSNLLNQTLNETMFPADELPLPPQITPAFSVAGVILMLTGVFYCLVGIKKKWLQISISSAYLVSLAITVLIVYIVNPPVSDAIQGAYLVGVVAPALVLGGIACIFHDVTEGLGCAVGGFAISMFFMVLKPGGLFTNPASKAIFIGVWTVAVFSFSFSHYTRTYALIGSTAIGGSTAVVLGIDCFSKAGLKEFWIYVWGLNQNLFPLLVQSYPMTRGIKVEIAGIVVFAFFGILSQLKIWKIVQERKVKKEQAKREADQARDELEAELGRQVEEVNERERGQWEAIYGDKEKRQQETHRDSGVGTETSSTQKESAYDEETKQEMTTTVRAIDTPAPQSPAATEALKTEPCTPHGIVIQVGEDEDMSQIRATPEAVTKAPAIVLEAPSPTPSQRTSVHEHGPPPRVPFSTYVPAFRQDDAMSTEAAAAAHSESPQPSPTDSNFSLGVAQQPNSKRLSCVTQSSMEAVMDPDFEESDAASEIVPEPAHEKLQAEQPAQTTLDDIRSVRSADQHSKAPAMSNVDKDDPPTEAVPTSPELPNDDISEKLAVSTHKDSHADSVVELVPVHPITSPPSESYYAPSVEIVDKVSTRSEKPAPVKPSLKSLANEQANPIVQRFRTNEWAKHLSLAEAPEVDTLRSDERKEVVSVVDTAALLQTPLTAEPEPEKIEVPPQTTTRPPPIEIPPQHSPELQESPERMPGSRNNGASSPAPSNGSVGSTGSQRPRPQPSGRKSSTAMLRSSITPLGNTPISENEAMTFHTSRAMPLPTGTLLAERSSMLAHKNMTGQMPRRSSSTGPYEISSPSSPESMINVNHMGSPVGSLMSLQQNADVLSDDTMPLSARKSHLKLQQLQQQQQQQQEQLLNSRSSTPSFPVYSSPRRSSTVPSPQQSAYFASPQAASPPPQGPIMTSPSPTARRSATDPALRQTSMLSAWRASMVADQRRSVGVDSPWTADAAPAASMPARAASKAAWRDGRTRNGAEGWGSTAEGQQIRRLGSSREVDNAHREVLRRMQAGANRKLATNDR